MFKQASSITLRKKRGCVEKKRGVNITKGIIRQVIHRRYSKGKIHELHSFWSVTLVN
jgi:hypothetical protein